MAARNNGAEEIGLWQDKTHGNDLNYLMNYNFFSFNQYVMLLFLVLIKVFQIYLFPPLRIIFYLFSWKGGVAYQSVNTKLYGNYPAIF
jgi:hypothetical protein